ncbi:MAG: PAS domain S-box protein, partial [Halieaceae bacterium]|nr:PAS domain S-box protein [Halieaceae bacterium]
MRTVPGAIYRYRRDSNGKEELLYVSDGCETLSEVPVAHLLANPSTLWSLVVPEDRSQLAEAIDRSEQTMSQWESEWRIKTPSGKLKWLSGRGTPSRLDDGSTVWTSVVIDVTQRSALQAALTNFFEQQLSLNMLVDLDGTILDVNGAWETLLGYTRAEMQGRHFIDFVHPEDAQSTLFEARSAVPTENESVDRENRYRHKDGSYRHLLWSSRTCTQQGITYAIATDITDKRRLESNLAQAAAVYRYTADGVAITDLDANVIDVNDAFEVITGYAREEVIGRNPRILKSGRHDSAFYDAMWRSLKEKGLWRGEMLRREGQAPYLGKGQSVCPSKYESVCPSKYILPSISPTAARRSNPCKQAD